MFIFALNKKGKAMGRLKKIMKKKIQGDLDMEIQERDVTKKEKHDDKALHLTEVSEEELLRWRIDVYPYLM